MSMLSGHGDRLKGEKPYNMYKYISFLGQLMWYTTKVVPDVVNAARELEVHMSHPWLEYWKSLGRLIGYLKGKETKGIVVRKLKVLIYVMFFGSNYATDKETINSVSGIFTTLVGTLLTFLSKTQRTVTLISTEA